MRKSSIMHQKKLHIISKINIHKVFILMFIMVVPVFVAGQTWTNIWSESFNGKTFESCYTTGAQTYWANCTSGPRNSMINGTWEVSNTNLGATQSPASGSGGRFLMYWSDNTYSSSVPAADSIIFSKTLTGLTPGRQYRITYKFGALVQIPSTITNPASVGLRLNNQLIIAKTTATTSWQTKTYTWTATSTSMKLDWINQVKEVNGNDVALDDLVVESFSTSPLPVTLTSFTASTYANCTALIRWHTEEERNFSHFEIERSADGTGFSSLASIIPQGQNSDYSYIDTKPFKGTTTYRLKMTDNDGSMTYSPVKTIIADCVASSINIYPVPAHDLITISGITSGARITVFNVMGQIVAEKTGTNTIETIDISLFKEGTYLLQVAANNDVFKSRIIKK